MKFPIFLPGPLRSLWYAHSRFFYAPIFDGNEGGPDELIVGTLALEGVSAVSMRAFALIFDDRETLRGGQPTDTDRAPSLPCTAPTVLTMRRSDEDSLHSVSHAADHVENSLSGCAFLTPRCSDH